jgi:RNA polymerase sigma-70 factor (ECF subfamily)
VTLDEAAAVAAAGTPEDEAMRHSDGARLAALLQRLPERERELLAMKFGAEMTNRAIATATGLTESNVGTIVHRAVQTLRERW